MRRFVSDYLAGAPFDQYREEVSMELARITREVDRLSYLVRAAEWLEGGHITEEQFLTITEQHRTD